MKRILVFLIPYIFIHAKSTTNLELNKSAINIENHTTIKRMENRHRNILIISKNIDRKVLRFMKIYNESKRMIKNSECIELNMAVKFLKEELITLQKDNSNAKIDIKGYKKMIINVVNKKNKKCGNKK